LSISFNLRQTDVNYRFSNNIFRISFKVRNGCDAIRRNSLNKVKNVSGIGCRLMTLTWPHAIASIRELSSSSSFNSRADIFFPKFQKKKEKKREKREK
jgi:hypothetical protein